MLFMKIYKGIFQRFNRILKHAFISHENNNHKPHILREITLILIILISVFFLGFSFARYYFLHKTVLGESIVSSVLIDLTNATREKYGGSKLAKSEKLEIASNLKAEDMAKYQYFSHNSPTGVTPWHWIKQAGYDFLYAGENLAIDFTQSKDVEDAWLKSPTHKANILDNKFTEIGISTKEGEIDGHSTIYVVQMFGAPKSSSMSSVEKNIPENNKTINLDENQRDKESDATINTTTTPTTSQKTIKEDQEIKNTEVALDTTEHQQDAQDNTDINFSNLENIIILEENKDFIVVTSDGTNTEDRVLGESTSSVPEQYSTFWQRILFDSWYTLNNFYKIIVVTISISILALFFSEFKKHHWKHIVYGLITILFLLILLYINKQIW